MLIPFRRESTRLSSFAKRHTVQAHTETRARAPGRTRAAGPLVRLSACAAASWCLTLSPFRLQTASAASKCRHRGLVSKILNVKKVSVLSRILTCQLNGSSEFGAKPWRGATSRTGRSRWRTQHRLSPRTGRACGRPSCRKVRALSSQSESPTSGNVTWCCHVLDAHATCLLVELVESDWLTGCAGVFSGRVVGAQE